MALDQLSFYTFTSYIKNAKIWASSRQVIYSFQNSGLPGLAMLHLKVLENSSVFFATELAKTLVQVFRKFE